MRQGTNSLTLCVLGGFRAALTSGEPVALSMRKSRALLAYLALKPDRAHSREHLAALLWGDRDESRAHNSLSQAVTSLRKGLAVADPPPLVIDSDSLTFRSATATVDALALEQLANGSQSGALEHALDLYQGDLLTGLGVHEPAFEDWLELERERLRALAVHSLAKLLELRQKAGEHSRAIVTARRLLELDPLHEAAHRALMRAYAGEGQIGLALNQYRSCVETLRRELGIEPDADTERVHNEILSQRTTVQTNALGNPSVAAESGEFNVVAREYVTQPPSKTERPTLPEGPSIAVLPFTNLSGDPEQEVFSDGITEDIITALSKISGLLVVARHSTAVYKGRTVDIRQVGREQGVRYVLEGSVRKSGGRVRITAQLIDSITGHHRWAERYDRDLGDIFSVQDDITKCVTVELQVRLTEGEQARVWSRGTDNIKAWENVVRAATLVSGNTKQDTLEARSLARAALELDAGFASAWIVLGWSHWQDSRHGWTSSQEESLALALEAAKKAHELENENPDNLALQGSLQMMTRNFDRAVELLKSAVSLAPNHSWITAILATVLNYSGEPQEGLQRIKRAMRLSPVYPIWFLAILGNSYYWLGEYDRAISAFKRAIEREPESILPRVGLTCSLVEAGLRDEAKAAAKNLLNQDPDFSILSWAGRHPYRNLQDLERLSLILASAGLPK